MSLLFYILAALLIYFSLKSVRGGFVYLNYFKQELAKPRPVHIFECLWSSVLHHEVHPASG